VLVAFGAGFAVVLLVFVPLAFLLLDFDALVFADLVVLLADFADLASACASTDAIASSASACAAPPTAAVSMHPPLEGIDIGVDCALRAAADA
jgi:hypothetical protein